MHSGWGSFTCNIYNAYGQNAGNTNTLILYSNIYNGQNAGNTHQHVDCTGPTPILKAFTKLPLIIHSNLELPTMQVGTHHLYWVEELACQIETRNIIENRNQSNVKLKIENQ